MSEKGISNQNHGSGLQPYEHFCVSTWGDAPGWDDSGPLALSAMPLPSAPKAHPHPSLGQRPRSAPPFAFSAKGASHDRPPKHGSGFQPWQHQLRRPGAMPQAGMNLGLWPAAKHRFRSAPRAHRHPSLGQGPRSSPKNALSAKGAPYDRSLKPSTSARNVITIASSR